MSDIDLLSERLR